jgi:filamentous hemagglutinin family protein
MKSICRDSAIILPILTRLFSFLGGLAIAFPGNIVIAQISPDETLGSERSVITPNINIQGAAADQVDGGAIRGSNLFHSFSEFNIKDGQRVYFSNPAGINNILGRVTGNNPSAILGILGVNGNANLFFINPNGIIFGQNASLDLRGSFVASTANAIQFGNGTQFSAITSQTTPLLTVAVPVGLQFGVNAASIQVQGNGQGQRLTSELIDTNIGLRVQPNQTLALVGGNIALEGGTLKTAGGRIELGSVTDSGLVSLTPIDSGFALGYSGISTFGNIQLSGGAVVDASGAGGGDIQVQGRRVMLQDGSRIEASTLGAEAGGTLTVEASEVVELMGQTVENTYAALFALVYPEAIGMGGNITVETGQLIIRDGAQIAAATLGEGNAGNLIVSARNFVEVIGRTVDNQFPSGLFTSSEAGAAGNGGNLFLQTGRLIVRDGAQIRAGTFSEGNAGSLTVSASESVEVVGASSDGRPSILFTSVNPGATGNGGNLSIATGRLIVQGGAQVVSGTFSEGNAGSLTVSAKEFVELIGTSADGEIPSGLFTSSEEAATGNGGNLRVETAKLILRDSAEIRSGTFGEGKAGDLKVETGQLIVQDGAQIQAVTFGKGDAGNLTVSATESVEVVGTSANGRFQSGLFTSVQRGATGNGGNLSVETGRLIVRDTAQIQSATFGVGNAGTLIVSAGESVELIGISADGRFSSALATSVEQGATGNGGKLIVDTGQLILRDGAKITSGTLGKGEAGNLTVSARSVELDNQAGIITRARTGNGGNITMQLQDLLLLRRNSQISSTAGTAQQDGNGGNITINAPKGFIVAPPNENSDITANAFKGSGGKVTINATGIFGIKPRSRQELERLLGTTDPTKLSPSQLATSDITAISQTNASLNGEVNLNTPDTDPSRGIEELPIDIVDVSGLINQNLCVASQGSEFIVTGRGGLPPSPYEVLSANTAWEDWWISSQPQTKPTPITNNSSPQQKKASATIIEAQGWITDANGNVILTAQPATVTPKGTWLHPQDCHMLRGNS